MIDHEHVLRLYMAMRFTVFVPRTTYHPPGRNPVVPTAIGTGGPLGLIDATSKAGLVGVCATSTPPATATIPTIQAIHDRPAAMTIDRTVRRKISTNSTATETAP